MSEERTAQDEAREEIDRIIDDAVERENGRLALGGAGVGDRAESIITLDGHAYPSVAPAREPVPVPRDLSAAGLAALHAKPDMPFHMAPIRNVAPWPYPTRGIADLSTLIDAAERSVGKISDPEAQMALGFLAAAVRALAEGRSL